MMTPATLKAWRQRLGMSQQKAAGALGISKRQYQNYEWGRAAIPRAIELACAALALGLTAYPS